ncbi:hypothetical protein [Winogradskyella sp.]|uniref:hypothetical protein n=1 Tax=Winogradskyella sp. TaxID=1883156 RepID=UPI00261E7F80|nr:hypothetical protein [Winogradskyella sp.]
MKLLKSFLLIIVLVAFSACSSDDDNGPTNIELTIENLTGTYELIYLRGSSQTTITATDGTTVVTETDVWEGDTFTNTVYEFNADGTYTTSGSFVETYTITVTGQSPETDSEIVDIESSGTYTVNTQNRTINFDGDEIGEVTLFNGTELRVVENYTETSDSFTETGTIEIRLIKQN